ncbi:DGQHR domain-containing protein [Fibrobacterota bacterium]
MEKTNDTSRYKCIVFNHGKYQLVMFSAPVSDLYNKFAINRKVQDKDKGYQRALSNTRVRAITRYINNNNPIPNSILISLDTNKFKVGRDYIYLNNSKNIGWVIDGQHRLAGAHESDKDIILPVIAFLGLSVVDQINQFVTINKEAKGVPTSLYYDLLKHLPKKSPIDVAKEKATAIANELRNNEESPFFNKIVSITSPKKGEISLTTFVRNVHILIQKNKGHFDPFTQLEQVRIISNYYNGLKNSFPNEFKQESPIFFQAVGFGALMKVLPVFFTTCLKIHKGFTIPNVTDLFTRLNYFEFDNWKTMGGGNAALTRASEELRDEIESLIKSESGFDSKLKL